MSLSFRRRTRVSLAGGLLPLVLLVLIVLAACTATPAASVAPSAIPTPAATSASPAAATAPAAASTPASVPASAPAVRQSDTAWGRIWDQLPPTFPQFPGAQPTQTGEGPASAILQIPATVPVAADWFGMGLETAGFTIAATNGPLEDGSFVIDATGSGTCKAQVSIAPMGGVTIATIFVGAGCAFV